MATVTYYEQSFLVPFWQNVVDWNAALVAVPLGTVSGSLSGFAFEDIGGTWTVFLGDIERTARPFVDELEIPSPEVEVAYVEERVRACERMTQRLRELESGRGVLAGAVRVAK